MLKFNDPRLTPIADSLRQLAREERCPLSFQFVDGERNYAVSIRLAGTDPNFDRRTAKGREKSGDYTVSDELERRVQAGQSLEAMYESHRESLTAIADGCTDAQDFRGRELVFELLKQLAATQQHFRLTRQLVETCWHLKSSPLVNGVRTPGELLAGDHQ